MPFGALFWLEKQKGIIDIADAVCSHCKDVVKTLGVTSYIMNDMSLVMRKPAFCICKNKDADQLRGNC